MAIKPIGENIKKPLTVGSSNIKRKVSEVMVRHGSINKEGDMTEITYFPDGRTYAFSYLRVGRPSKSQKITKPPTIDITAKVRED